MLTPLRLSPVSPLERGDEISSVRSVVFAPPFKGERAT